MVGEIVLRVFLSVIILIVIFGVGMFACSMILLKAHYGDKEEMLNADRENAKKALIVYQPSVTSASSDVAHSIARGLNDEGYEVLLNHPGDHMSSDISPYSIIVLGSPVYAGKTSESLAEYIQRAGDLSDKKVIVFFTAGSIDAGPESDRMEALLNGAEPYAGIKFKFDESEANEQKAYQLGLDAAGED